MPVSGGGRSFSGTHTTGGYDASARRADKSRSGSQANTQQRKARRSGRK